MTHLLFNYDSFMTHKLPLSAEKRLVAEAFDSSEPPSGLKLSKRK